MSVWFVRTFVMFMHVFVNGIRNTLSFELHQESDFLIVQFGEIHPTLQLPVQLKQRVDRPSVERQRAKRRVQECSDTRPAHQH